LSKSCIDIVAVLENVHNEEHDAKVPQVLQMLHEGCCIVDQRAGIQITVLCWTGDE
jgi:hypothetical protein